LRGEAGHHHGYGHHDGGRAHLGQEQAIRVCGVRAGAGAVAVAVVIVPPSGTQHGAQAKVAMMMVPGTNPSLVCGHVRPAWAAGLTSRMAGCPTRPITACACPTTSTCLPGAILRRVAIAVGLMLVNWLLVIVERDGYRDAVDGSVSVIDALYYTTVTLSTTGYGDITPVTQSAVSSPPSS
jgi:hypothetical protein